MFPLFSFPLCLHLTLFPPARRLLCPPVPAHLPGVSHARVSRVAVATVSSPPAVSLLTATIPLRFIADQRRRLDGCPATERWTGGKSSLPAHDLQHRRRTSCNLFIANPRAAALSAFKQQLPGAETRRVVEYVGEFAASLKSGLHQVLVSLKMAFCKNQQQSCDQFKVSQQAESGEREQPIHPPTQTHRSTGRHIGAAPTAQKSFVLAH